MAFSSVSSEYSALQKNSTKPGSKRTSLGLAGEVKATATVNADRLESINDVFQRIIHDKIEDRVVPDMAG